MKTRYLLKQISKALVRVRFNKLEHSLDSIERAASYGKVGSTSGITGFPFSSLTYRNGISVLSCLSIWISGKSMYGI